jgi:hypothetical protein
MGLSRLTVLEIYTNPADLEFQIAESDGKYAVMVTRGPGHKFKLLLTTEAVFEKCEVAIDSIRAVLDATLREGRQAFSEHPGALNQENVDRILRELAEKSFCSTCLF